MPAETRGPTRRLHPSSLLFQFARIGRALVFPAIAAGFFSRADLHVWPLIFVVPAVAGALIKFWTYRYHLGSREIVVREGVLTRNERHIPYARIQNVNLVQNLLHRWFGVAEVRLETAGGTEMEAVMRVLSLEAVDRIRKAVASAGGAGGAATEGEETEPGEQTLLRLPPREIALFGVISNRGMVIVAAVAGLLWRFEPMDLEQRISDLIEGLSDGSTSLPLPGALVTTVLVIAGVVLLLLLLRVLSIAWAFLKFHGFHLRRRGEDLRTGYGLLTRIAATVPRHRIQLLSIRQEPLHRLFGRALVQAETAGGTRDGEGGESGQRWLAPVIRAGDVSALVAEALPAVDLDAISWRPVSSGARRRVFRKGTMLVMIVSAAAAPALGFWALAVSAAGIPLAWFHAVLAIRHTAWAVTGAAIAYRSGWWVRRTSVARIAKVQVVAVRESPFDRRNGMVSVHVDTAGSGKVGHRVRIPYLDRRTGRELSRQLSRVAGATVFRW